MSWVKIEIRLKSFKPMFNSPFYFCLSPNCVWFSFSLRLYYLLEDKENWLSNWVWIMLRKFNFDLQHTHGKSSKSRELSNQLTLWIDRRLLPKTFRSTKPCRLKLNQNAVIKSVSIKHRLWTADWVQNED